MRSQPIVTCESKHLISSIFLKSESIRNLVSLSKFEIILLLICLTWQIRLQLWYKLLEPCNQTYFNNWELNIYIEKAVEYTELCWVMVKCIMIWGTNNSMTYRTWGFSTAFTKALPSSLSWVDRILSILQIPTSARSVLILSSHLHLGLPCGLLSIKILKAFLPFPFWLWVSHLNLLDLITLRVLEEWLKSQGSSFFGANIRLAMLFSNTFNLWNFSQRRISYFTTIQHNR